MDPGMATLRALRQGSRVDYTAMHDGDARWEAALRISFSRFRGGFAVPFADSDASGSVLEDDDSDGGIEASEHTSTGAFSVLVCAGLKEVMRLSLFRCTS